MKGAAGASFVRGLRLGLPIVLGYLPVGFAFGVLAVKAGLSPLESGLMCLLVFAGASQLIAVNLMLGAVSPPAIIMTTFVVNARHMLMSAALVPFLGRWSRKQQLAYCVEMSDETFALNAGRFMEKGVDGAEAAGVHLAAHLAWIAGGLTGALSGGLIADLRPWGLDFALTGMFLALLTPYCKKLRFLAAGLLGGLFSTLFCLGGMDQWNVPVAALAAATLALILRPERGEEGGSA